MDTGTLSHRHTSPKTKFNAEQSYKHENKSLYYQESNSGPPGRESTPTPTWSKKNPANIGAALKRHKHIFICFPRFYYAGAKSFKVQARKK